MLTDEQLQEIEARCEAASDGPWISQCNRWDNGTYSGTTTYVVLEGEGPICEVWDRDMHQKDVQDNANFMSHARTDIPSLIDHIHELEEEKARFPHALVWTTQPPQAPGWYWVRSVCPDTGIASPAIAFHYNDGACEVAKKYPYQWAGPIPEPLEPRP